MEDIDGPDLPIQDITQMQNEIRLATREKDFLTTANNTRRIDLKNMQTQVTILSQGNTAVSKEI